MLAYDHLRTGFRPFFRRARAARLASPAMLLAHIGEPAAFPTTRPLAALAPTGDARLLRRLRHVVRRRVKVELDGLVGASVSDGEIELTIRTVSAATRTWSSGALTASWSSSSSTTAAAPGSSAAAG